MHGHALHWLAADSLQLPADPSAMASSAGKFNHTSVHSAAITSFLRPVALTLSTNFLSPQEFIEVRSTGL